MPPARDAFTPPSIDRPDSTLGSVQFDTPRPHQGLSPVPAPRTGEMEILADRLTEAGSGPGAGIATGTGGRVTGRVLRRVVRRAMPQGRRQHRLAVVTALTPVTLALAGLTVADLRATRTADDVTGDLVTAGAAAGRIPADLTGLETRTPRSTGTGSGSGRALDADLAGLARAANRAREGSSGIAWSLATRFGADRTRLATLHEQARRTAELGEAATALRPALDPLTTGRGGVGERTGQLPLDALDALARGLNRYATAAERTNAHGAARLARTALAAGLLPGLAGAEGPRTWSVCRTVAGPCLRARLELGRVTLVSAAPAPAVPPGHQGSTGPDILVTGVPPRSLFDRVGTWDAAAALDLLDDLGGGNVTMRSPVPTEQQALAELSRRPPGVRIDRTRRG